MKIKVAKEELLKGIQVVQNVVSSKATLPILSNILVETKGTRLKLNTTDLDIGISCEILGDVLEEGAITIPAKRFSDIIRELPQGEATVSAKKNYQIDIEGTHCRFKLIGLPKEEFPKFPEFKDKNPIKIQQKIFKDMIRMTAFAVSHEESRYVLNGILMETSGNILRMVATDGRRLAKIEQDLISEPGKAVSVIIPSKAIQEIYRNLSDEGEVTVLTGTNQVLFDIEGILIATRIIEGEFPDYRQVIPHAVSPKIKVPVGDLLSAIRRANLLATPDFQAIKVEVFSDKLVISKTTPDIGESREEVAVIYGGKEFIVGFNPQFLIDVLKNIDQETIHLELLGPDKAGVIRQGNYLYMALPMRI